MVNNKVQQMFQSIAAIGLGALAGAIFTGVSVQLPMLVEAKWDEGRHIIFDSRNIDWCEPKDVEPEQAILQ